MLMRLRAYVKALLRREAIDREVDEELRFHVEMETQANVERGMTPVEARRVALVRMGGVSQAREQVRALRKTWLDGVWQDVRYAVRLYGRHKVSTAFGLVVLALGIGIPTAFFSIVNAFLIRPLAVRMPGELRYAYLQSPEQPDRPMWMSFKEYEHLRDHSAVFREVMAHAPEPAVLRDEGQGVPVTGETVSANYFEVLGVRPALGRTFTARDEAEDAEPTVVIGEALWASRFNRDPNILGKTIRLDHGYSGLGRATSDLRRYAVVGVVGGAFRGTLSAWESTHFWVPIRARAADLQLARPSVSVARRRDAWPMAVVGRLKAGVTDAQAESALSAADLEWARREYPNRVERRRLVLQRSATAAALPFEGGWQLVPSRLGIALMAVAVGILLVAAGNLAALVVARGVTRRPEIAVRLALGAERRRVTRQVVTESLILSLAGGLCALPISRIVVMVWVAATPMQFGGRFSRVSQLSLDVPLDLGVLGFTVLACVATGLLVGYVSARQASRGIVLAGLSGGAAAMTRPFGRAHRYGVVLPQVCLSLTLLVPAGMLVRSVWAAESASRGYDVEPLALVEYQLPLVTRDVARSLRSDDPRLRETWQELDRRAAAFERSLLRTIASSAGTESVTLADVLPWEGMRSVCSVLARKDYGRAVGANRWVQRVEATPGYFTTFGIRITRGRGLDETDMTSEAKVSVVSESLARLLWPGEDAVGQYLAHYDPADAAWRSPDWRRVVGIARDTSPVLSWGVPRPTVYFPLEGRNIGNVLIARTRDDPDAVAERLRGTVRGADGQALVLRVRSGRRAVDEVLYPRRAAALTLLACGLAGLFLSVVGLYGIVSYSVTQRTREMGIRAALGAGASDIVRLVLGEAFGLLVVGSLLGFALAVAAIRLTSSFVVTVPGIDLVSGLAMWVLVAVAVLLAYYLPARRAASLDPVAVLKVE